MEERIDVFLCPYFYECHKPAKELLYADGNTITFLEPPTSCKAPFLKMNGGPLCRLTAPPDKLDEYPNVIKNIKLSKSPLKEFLNKVIGFLSGKEGNDGKCSEV